MARISVETWKHPKLEMHLKRCTAAVTGWWDRYWYDIFFRTEVNVVALQIVFSFVILGLVWVSFNILYRDISRALLTGISDGVQSGNPNVWGPSIIAAIQQIRIEGLTMIVGAIVFTTAVFGYIVARLTLSPAHGALAAQKQFIGNVAHELRTPLSIIKTNTELALLDTSLNATQRETLASTIEELDRASGIINNLLSLSNLVRPEQMRFTAVDLSAVAVDVARAYEALAKRTDVHVTVRRSDDTLVWGNAIALQQIIGNLLKNALSYTPRGGNVRITITSVSRTWVELAIKDSGVGIARKDLLRIFEPFYRAYTPSTSPEHAEHIRHGGSGLGLAIVSELLKLHHGRISIRSSVGHGTTVTVLLPTATAHVSEVDASARGPNEIAVDFSTPPTTQP